MHQRKIGSLTVSGLGLGCMNMSFGYGAADDKVSTRLLNQAIDTGYTFFDTALVYGSGHNESLIGSAISQRRHEYILATKCGLSREHGINGRPDLILESCEASLKRLQTDYIDLYYLHRVDPNVAIEESIGAITRLVEQGKVREIGLSEVCSENLKRAHREYSIAAVQSEYSLWSRTPERAVIKTCKELGVTLVPFSPLGRAFLTGKAKDVSQLPDDDLRCTIARPRFEPDAFARNKKLLEPFAAIAQANDCSMAQLALAWLMARENRTMVPIPGTKRIEFMEENAGASEIVLDRSTVDELDELINESTISGTRYTAARMADTDAERD
ncbi:MAG: aldo/keto reductase [Hyphomicrobiales bacterium]|nr:aldo/keto reductase [Hyphomicrobiales bacterium]